MTKIWQFFKQHQVKTWELLKAKPLLFPLLIVSTIVIEILLSWLVENTQLPFWAHVAISQFIGLVPVLFGWRYLLNKKAVFKPSTKEVVSLILVGAVLSVIGVVLLNIWFYASAGAITIGQMLILIGLFITMVVFVVKAPVTFPVMFDREVWVWDAINKSAELAKGKAIYLALLLVLFLVFDFLPWRPEVDMALSYIMPSLMMFESTALYLLLK